VRGGMTALDASAALLAIARERLPAADVRQGDLEALPFADVSVDVVTAVNSIFYAADMAAAMRELSRVVRPGGRIVVTAWGPPERCEFRWTSGPCLRPSASRSPDPPAEAFQSTPTSRGFPQLRGDPQGSKTGGATSSRRGTDG
jgi:ubiquinone/menaquinone biosynthesis C-methylase UbiE